MPERQPGRLILADGAEFPGQCFGAARPVRGEVVFSTGMVGYCESLTDPSYCDQVLVFTYPLIGNYGVPRAEQDDDGLERTFESPRIHAAGVVVACAADDTTHFRADQSFHSWLCTNNVSGLTGVDTRALTQHLRGHGSMAGVIVAEGDAAPPADSASPHPVARVSHPEVRAYGRDGPRVVLLDTGVKHSIIRSLVHAGARVVRVPWNHDFMGMAFDGLLVGNGPGDPKQATESVNLVRQALTARVPTFGICLGHQLLALAAGGDTYKLKFGHRGHNQPCSEVGTERCYITSQNHGYAVDVASLSDGWRVWFTNANDGTNEGIRHAYLPACSVQFHPEAAPGPRDTAHLFHRFVETLR